MDFENTFHRDRRIRNFHGLALLLLLGGTIALLSVAVQAETPGAQLMSGLYGVIALLSVPLYLLFVLRAQRLVRDDQALLPYDAELQEG